MDRSGKISLALRACAQHLARYGHAIPPRLEGFWRTGEAFEHDRKCLAEGTLLPGFEPGAFRLVTTVPSWEVHADAGSLDDAVVGPRGDWGHAGLYLPLFQAEQAGFVVARLDDQACPIGWFEEGAWSSGGDGYHHGVYALATSLDDFLSTLVDLDEATFETEADEELWEDAADALEA